MERKVSRSLAYAMCEVLRKRLLNHLNAFIYDAYLYKPNNNLYGYFDSSWRVRLSWHGNIVGNSPLMKVDAAGKVSFFNLNAHLDNPDVWGRHIHCLNNDNTALLFNELCRLSDEGYAIAAYKSELRKKKEIITFIQPFEGSSMQIEADLLQPDFADMDPLSLLPLPF